MRIVWWLWAIALWLVQILLAVVIVLAGLLQFGEPSWQRNFARWSSPAPRSKRARCSCIRTSCSIP